MRKAFGLDIGGTGIKGAVVDIETGELVGERCRLDTPQPANIEAIVGTTAAVVEMAGWDGPIGGTFPGIMKRGVVGLTANVDDEWMDVSIEDKLAERLGHPARVVNDADAAGVAEMRLGAGRDVDGVVIVITLGTGIGTAIFNDGVLLPNAELGHLHLNGNKDIETITSAKAREREDLSWKQWGKRLQRYFSHLELLFSPDLFIVGGGISRKADRFLPLLDLKAPIVPAQLRQNSGIVGAAILGAEQ